MQAHESWFRSSPRTISTRDGALRLENFRVTQLTTGDDATVVDRPVSAVSEGRTGCTLSASPRARAGPSSDQLRIMGLVGPGSRCPRTLVPVPWRGIVS